MQSNAVSPDQYIHELEDVRKNAFIKLRDTILNNLPDGFIEQMNYGMIGYVVPHSIYPDGYHCDPKQPLPFINIASQKNFVAFYHMGLYANKELFDWFVASYPTHSSTKLDMGKSCVRFKKIDQLPYLLIGELCQKISVDEWVNLYESEFKRQK